MAILEFQVSTMNDDINIINNDVTTLNDDVSDLTDELSLVESEQIIQDERILELQTESNGWLLN